MSALIEVTDREFILVEEPIVSTLEIECEETLTVVEDVLAIVSEVGQGPQGIRGPKGDEGQPGGSAIERIAAINLSGHRIVMLNGAGEATYASNARASDASRVIGMTTHAAVAGSTVILQKFGELVEPSWNWDTSKPVYLSIDGLLTQVEPLAPQASFQMVIGFPISPTTLFINLGITITLTA